MRRLLVLVSFAITGLGFCLHFVGGQDGSDIIVERGIEFGKVGEELLRLDIARPKGSAGARPLLIFLPGGSYRVEGKAFYGEIVQAAERGYVAVRVSYRLLIVQPDGTMKNLFPAPLEDVRMAISWLRQHSADYGIDPQRIGIIGASAGAHLALLVGLQPSDQPIQAVVSFSAPTDFVAAYQKYQQGRPLMRLLLGKSMEEAPDLYRDASPISFVSAGDPPVLTIHGDRDHRVPIEQARAFDERMRAVGVLHQFVALSGEGHRMTSQAMQTSHQKMYEFLAAHLRFPSSIQTAATVSSK